MGGVVLTSILYAYHFVAPFLLSDQLLTWLYGDADFRRLQIQGGDQEYFTLIWHTLWGGPFTLFGGCVARYVYLHARQPKPAARD